jgi:uncharacterized protein (DUF1684 family)
VSPASSGWERRLEEERGFKDGFFAAHPDSPLPLEERGEFKGLDYYPLDPGYRFELELHEHGVKERVEMSYTRGEEREFLRWGEFRFRAGGKGQVLQAYKKRS